MVKTLVVGFGNPILCDDGVGNRVAQEISKLIRTPDITVIETSAAGLDFIDLLDGYDKAIIIDAMMSGKGKPGEICRLPADAINCTLHSVSLHDISLGSALELGKRLGNNMPEEIIIYGIEVQNVDIFSEKCSSQVELAIPDCVRRVVDELEGDYGE